MGERWGDLVFIPHSEGQVLDEDVPEWRTDGPVPSLADEWHPSDRPFAPLYSPGTPSCSVSEQADHSAIRVGDHTMRVDADFGIIWARYDMSPDEVLESIEQQKADELADYQRSLHNMTAV